MHPRNVALGLAAALVPVMGACAQTLPRSVVDAGPAYFEPASTLARQMVQNAPVDTSRPSDPDETRLLVAHNTERVRVGAPPLVWSEALEVEARDWATQLMDTDSFAHDPRPHGHGENLWMGWGNRVFTPEDMVGDWIVERSDYRAGVFPDVSRTGNWVAVGHYTQLIWRDTTHVGCAIVRRGDRAILACRYAPPGNIDGRRP